MSAKPLTKDQPTYAVDKQVFNAAGVLLQFLASPEEVGDAICPTRSCGPSPQSRGARAPGTMRFNLKKVALLSAWTILAGGGAYPQDAIDKLQALVGTSARRLAIAEQVALAKWDNGMPVEDASREDHVIVSATKAGQSRGLDPRSVSNFFRAQIEANKLVQYSLLAEWRRAGKTPDHTPVDLTSTIRPQLDEVDKALIAELEESTAIRASASCPIQIAKAAGRYVSAHSLGSVEAIALDRALATACVGPPR